jgi:hypothetical protein
MGQDTDAYELGDPYEHERIPPGWTEGDVERLVAKVSQRVIDNLYQEVGKSVVKRILQAIGWAAVFGLAWLGASNARKWIP